MIPHVLPHPCCQRLQHCSALYSLPGADSAIDDAGVGVPIRAATDWACGACWFDWIDLLSHVWRGTDAAGWSLMRTPVDVVGCVTLRY